MKDWSKRIEKIERKVNPQKTAVIYCFSDNEVRIKVRQYYQDNPYGPKPIVYRIDEFKKPKGAGLSAQARKKFYGIER